MLLYSFLIFLAGIVTAVSPPSASVTGGTTVTISGTNLGNGSDITSVTMIGVAVTSIVSQTSASVTVIVGSRSMGAIGNIVVSSVSRGQAVGVNKFIYAAGMFTI